MSKEKWRRSARRLQKAVKEWEVVFRHWLIVIVAGAVLLAVGLLVFSPILQVREVRVQRTPRLDVEEVQRVLSPTFGRHLAFLSPYEVSLLLRKEIPDVNTIEVSKEYPSTLIVRITLDTIIARLQIDDPEALEDRRANTGALAQDYLTDEGMYVTYPLVEEEEPLLHIRLVDWGVRPNPGTKLLSKEFLDRVRATEQALVTQFGQEVRARAVYLRAREYHITTDRFTLWFDIASSLEDQLQRYRIFLRTVGPGEALHYVDLRLSDRVVYK